MYRNAHSFTVFFLGEPDSSVFIGRLLIGCLALHQIEVIVQGFVRSDVGSER
jgi:hypothetical protein